MSLRDSLMPPAFREVITTPVRRVYTSVLVACLGTGLTLSMFILYLHNVRHFSPFFAAGMLTTGSLIGLCISPLWGTMVDRYGPFPCGLIGYLGNGVAMICFGFATSHVTVLLAVIGGSLFGGGAWGPNSVLLARLVPEEHRQRAFGLNFMIVNVAIGFGGLLSAVIVDLHHPATFTALYAGTGIMNILAAGNYARLRQWGGPVTDHREVGHIEEGWKVVLGDRRFMRYIATSLILSLGGYTALDSGFSLFSVNNLHITVHSIGLIFFFNTTCIVVFQFAVVNQVEKRSRTRMLALTALIWAAFWLILASALALPHALVVPLLCVNTAIFAIGEMILQPVTGALTNQMAPEHLRGRYNSAAGTVWGMAGAISPLITSLYFTFGAGNWWPCGTAVTAVLAAILFRDLTSRLTDEEDGRRPKPSSTNPAL